jgi:neurotransmitter:Na+ symporter, NSS family
MIKAEKRELFGSRFGAVMAFAGSAIGLGNMWRFPYLVGQNGGAVFIIIYLVLLTFICLPVLMSEFLIGRRSHSNAFRAFGRISGSNKWNFIGFLAVCAAVCVLSFYCVVGGWSVKYFIDSATLQLISNDTVYSKTFTEFISSTYSPITFTYIFLALTGIVLLFGVSKGIEKFSKVMMTLLFFLIILIAIRSVTLPGSSEGLKYLFVPDASKINGQVILAALGQAFFSLSIGCGTMLTYGSYVNDDENIVKASSYTALFDTTFALLAGIAIIPAVFAIAQMNGSTPEINAGPGLVFITLPGVFREMPLGSLVAILFFISLLLAAITSSISLMETIVAFVKEEWKRSRIASVIIVFFLCAVLGTFCSLSQGVLADVHILGSNIFDFFDKLSSNVLMAGGGLLMVLFAGWRMKKEDYMSELGNNGKSNTPKWVLKSIYLLVRYIAPIGIISIMIGNYL